MSDGYPAHVWPQELRDALAERFGVEVNALKDLTWVGCRYLGTTVEIGLGGGAPGAHSVFILPSDKLTDRPRAAVWLSTDNPPYAEVGLHTLPPSLRAAHEYAVRWLGVHASLKALGSTAGRTPRKLRAFVGPMGATDKELSYHSEIAYNEESERTIRNLSGGTFRVVAQAYDAEGVWPWWDTDKGGRL